MAFHAENISDNKWRVTAESGTWTVNCSDENNTAGAAIELVQSMLSDHGKPTSGQAEGLMRQAVNAEAARRIWQVLGATDLEGATIKQLNHQKTVMRLQQKMIEGGTLDAEEQAALEAILAGDAQIEAIRAVANVLTGSNPVPQDYADPKHWP